EVLPHPFRPSDLLPFYFDIYICKMKYIIIGLGNFGASLAAKLTMAGNEVIGVDSHMEKVEALKDKIYHTVRLDATDAYAVSSLPLRDTDVVIIAIGEDQGANIMATAVMRNHGVNRLISRAVSPLHEAILQAMGVTEIVHPEEETAERWAKKLTLKGLVDSFEIDRSYSIAEVLVPDWCAGKRVGEINFRTEYNLVMMTTIKTEESRNLLGAPHQRQRVQGVATPDSLLEKGDIMVIYGDKKNIRRFVEKSS